MSDQAKDERAPDEVEATEATAERTEGSIDGDYLEAARSRCDRVRTGS